jgi:lysozyme
MKIDGLLNVTSKIGTPLALAGIIVIVLYALYKQVLALNLFAPIDAAPTARLLQNVLNKLFWLALIALILGVASYIVTALFPQDTQPTSSEERKSPSTDSTTLVFSAPVGFIHTGQGDITVTNFHGLSEEQRTRLAKELEVTQAALNDIFRILERQQTPLENLDSKVREVAATYKRLNSQLQHFVSKDHATMPLRHEARKALQIGDFTQVESLLKQARGRDPQAIQEPRMSFTEQNTKINSRENIEELIKTVSDRIMSGSLIEDFDITYGIAPPPVARPLTRLALHLIKHFEGWEPLAYNDPVGYCTIGYGHLISLRRCEDTDLGKYSSALSESAGEILLITDTNSARLAVQDLVSVDLTDEQFSALSSLVFNIGKENFKNSTILKLLNSREYEFASREFSRWVRSKGQILLGLVERRGCERTLFVGQLLADLQGRFNRSACISYGAAPDAGPLIDIEAGE